MENSQHKMDKERKIAISKVVQQCTRGLSDTVHRNSEREKQGREKNKMDRRIWSIGDVTWEYVAHLLGECPEEKEGLGAVETTCV